MRSLIKRVAEHALVTSGVAGCFRRRLNGRTLVLAYHNIVPDDAECLGDRANHLPVSMFEAQMNALQKTHDVIPLASSLELVERTPSRPRVCITFDDAYRGAVVHGASTLAKLQLPGTIFVAPAFIGGCSFWWDALALGDGLRTPIRDRAIGELRGRDSDVRDWAQGEGMSLGTPHLDACAATLEELRHAAALPGISVGSHTWSHPNLTRLDPTELANELERPLVWLRDNVPNFLPWIAYPYGIFDARVEKAAAYAGYHAALGVSGGWYPSVPESLYALPRENIPRGLSVGGFVLRTAGLLNS